MNFGCTFFLELIPLQRAVAPVYEWIAVKIPGSKCFKAPRSAYYKGFALRNAYETTTKTLHFQSYILAVDFLTRKGFSFFSPIKMAHFKKH